MKISYKKRGFTLPFSIIALGILAVLGSIYFSTKKDSSKINKNSLNKDALNIASSTIDRVKEKESGLVNAKFNVQFLTTELNNLVKESKIEKAINDKVFDKYVEVKEIIKEKIEIPLLKIDTDKITLDKINIEKAKINELLKKIEAEFDKYNKIVSENVNSTSTLKDIVDDIKKDILIIEDHIKNLEILGGNNDQIKDAKDAIDKIISEIEKIIIEDKTIVTDKIIDDQEKKLDDAKDELKKIEDEVNNDDNSSTSTIYIPDLPPSSDDEDSGAPKLIEGSNKI